MKLFLMTVLSLVLPLISYAAPSTTHNGSVDEQQQASQWNQTHAPSLLLRSVLNWAPARPFSELETTGFVAISGAGNSFELPALRKAIAQNLPPNVTLIIYVSGASQVPALKKIYSQFLDTDHLKFLVVATESDSDVIWARDSLPVPVHMADGRIGLVNSIYPQSFEPDAEVAKALSLPMISTNVYFRGGNMLVDADDNCFSEIASEVKDLGSGAHPFFTKYFGCKTVTLLKHEGGIGDIDERLKFMNGKDVLTDNDLYTTQLTAAGYTIHRIPSTGNNMETYMNTLYVNGTIFVPQMGIAADKAALDAYRAFGLKPIGVNTKQLADQDMGNIHCLTMNYPPGTFAGSLRGKDFVEFAH